MDKKSLMCLFCLLTAVSTQDYMIKKVKEEGESITVECTRGHFEGKDITTLKLTQYDSGDYTCRDDNNEETIAVRIRTSENLIQMDTMATVSILLGDIIATVLIGWAVYSICTQHKPKSSYQGNKASDRQNLISNAGGDTYQPLNSRTDEYSMLQPTRKNKNRP